MCNVSRHHFLLGRSLILADPLTPTISEVVRFTGASLQHPGDDQPPQSNLNAKTLLPIPPINGRGLLGGLHPGAHLGTHTARHPWSLTTYVGLPHADRYILIAQPSPPLPPRHLTPCEAGVATDPTNHVGLQAVVMASLLSALFCVQAKKQFLRFQSPERCDLGLGDIDPWSRDD